MTFNLEITITGICGFVENSKGTIPRVCVVMPSDVNRSAHDDEPLCPHECYIEQGYGFARTKTSILGQRVDFVVGGQSDPPIKLPIATNDDIGIISVADSGIKDPVNPGVVSMPPRETLVKAQVLLNYGIVDVMEAGGHWAIMEGDQNGVRVAHELRVTLRGLDSAILWLYPFTREQPTAVNFTPPAGISTVALRIVNTCVRKTYLPRRESLRDRDFKWYYQLLTQPLGGSLGNKDLPIPRFLRGSLIGGNNCFPGHLGSTPLS